MFHQTKMASTSSETKPQDDKPKKTKKAPVKKKEEADSDAPSLSWDVVDVLTDEIQWERWAVKNTVKLLDEDNTIPFIARYRKEQTNNMEADKIRDLHSKYEELK